MRLLVLTMAVQPRGPLAFILDWVRSLAGKVESIDIVANVAEPVELPSNVRVHSLGRERGYGSTRRGLRFYRILLAVLGSRRIDACFCHQIPALGAAAGPVLRLRGIPLVTWFAHPSLTWQTRLAHRFSSRVVSVIPGSYPYKKDKLVAIGQKIDTGTFRPAEREGLQETAGLQEPERLRESKKPTDPPLILCVGRLSPIKDHPTLLDACARLRDAHDFEVAIVGAPAVPSDHRYVARLEETVERLGLGEIVLFVPGLERRELPPWYRRATIHVNLSPPGSADKAALEAMACGTPSLVAHRGFEPTLGRYADELTFEHGDAGDLAARIDDLLRLPPDRRREMGEYLRGRITEMHDVDGWTDRLLEVLRHV